uniref:Putative secreted protein n=1 Tax=Anopheles darlingi TaxID=43151 RepID=A0A2M4D3Y8_ANODA
MAFGLRFPFSVITRIRSLINALASPLVSLVSFTKDYFRTNYFRFKFHNYLPISKLRHRAECAHVPLQWPGCYSQILSTCAVNDTELTVVCCS